MGTGFLETVMSSPAKAALLLLALHVLADFVVLGRLADMKSDVWWDRKFNGHPWANKMALLGKYGRDYMVCVSMHALLWALAVFLPIWVSPSCSDIEVVGVVIVNALVHAVADNMYNNRPMSINLVQDQIVHIVQIACTLAWWFLAGRF